MQHIDEIVSEQIENFLFENVFDENFFMERKKKKKSGKKEDKDEKKHKKRGDGDEIRKKRLKAKGGSRKDFDVTTDKLSNPNLNNQDTRDLASILDSEYVNLAAVARDTYPDHTDEGAQSQLRKKVKGLKSDSGSKYKIKKKEADKIRKSLLKHLRVGD